MYINTGYEITNTPNHFTAGFNTWPYYTRDQRQHVERYYIDHTGQVRTWNHWNPPQMVAIPGGMYKGTSTRTGGFYAQNTIPSPSGAQYYGDSCMN